VVDVGAGETIAGVSRHIKYQGKPIVTRIIGDSANTAQCAVRSALAMMATSKHILVFGSVKHSYFKPGLGKCEGQQRGYQSANPNNTF
jgi:hypothetical protein